MIFATPFHPSLTDFADYARVLKKKGQLLNHVHVVITTAAHEDAAYEFGLEVSELFGRSMNVTLPVLDRTKIGTANDLFRSAVRFAANYTPGADELAEPALLYGDPTYRPVKTGWLDKIQSEYYQSAAPMAFGRSEAAKDGARLFHGPVVLHRDFAKKSGLLDFIPPTVHWRSHLRWELTAEYVDTKLIGAGAESVLKPKASA